MPQMHHLVERGLQSIGKTGLSRGKLMRGAAKSGNRAEAARSRIHWIGTAAVIAHGELALNPPVTVRNDLPSALRSGSGVVWPWRQLQQKEANHMRHLGVALPDASSLR